MRNALESSAARIVARKEADGTLLLREDDHVHEIKGMVGKEKDL